MPSESVADERRRPLVKILLLFLIWLLLLGAAYWYFLVKPKQWFDPLMQQPPVLSIPAEQAQLRLWLQQHFPELRSDQSWFIRMRQSSCGCERFVELYHQSFERGAAGDSLQVATLDFDKTELDSESRALLQRLIPATPSVVLFNASGEVVYFGPYHQEGICNADNSYLEPVLNALRQGQQLSVLNTLVFGCFCHTSLL